MLAQSRPAQTKSLITSSGPPTSPHDASGDDSLAEVLFKPSGLLVGHNGLALGGHDRLDLIYRVAVGNDGYRRPQPGRIRCSDSDVKTDKEPQRRLEV